MGRIRRRFDAKFKEEICQAILSGQEIREICQDHQLHRQTVERWLERFQQGEDLGRPSTREKALERENEKLKAKIGDLVVQMDLLKKFHKTLQRKKSVNSSVITGKNLAQFQKPAKG
jgi:transposase-like protein